MRESTAVSARALGFNGAFIRQFRLLWTSRRPLLLAVGLLAALVLSGDPWVNDELARLLTLWPFWLVLVGPAWAFAVFHDEGPSRRLYQWSLPVGRTTHTVARIAAGLAWLWIDMALLVAVGAGVAAGAGDLWQLGAIGPAGWVNWVTGPTLGYLAVSLLTVTSDYPLRWFFGLLFAFPLALTLLDELLGLDDLAAALVNPLADDGWGFFPVLVGGLGEEVARVEETARQLAGQTFQSSFAAPEHWWVATAGWLVILAGLLVLAASRHPDRLPRLHRSG